MKLKLDHLIGFLRRLGEHCKMPPHAVHSLAAGAHRIDFVPPSPKATDTAEGGCAPFPDAQRLTPNASDCDLACPVCHAADAVKIALLRAGEPSPWPEEIGWPYACIHCWSLIVMCWPQIARPSDWELDAFRARFPSKWDALAKQQAAYRREQLRVVQ